MDAQAFPILLGGGFFLVLAGGVLLYLAHRADTRNWFVERAPRLPIRLAQAADDVWVRGEVVCPHPLLLPYFELPSIHYVYEVEKKVTRTRVRKGKRETYTTWVTDHSASETTRFRLVDGDAALEVRAEEAEFADLESTGTEYESSRRRHSARYFAPHGEASAAGVVDDQKRTIGRRGEIPLVVTRRKREEYVRDVERSESLLRGTGVALGWLGSSLAALAVAVWLGWLPLLETWRDWILPGLAAAAAGLAPLSVVWSAFTFNRLVAYRHRTRNAWRLIDVDLKNRYDLIPRLADVVRAAAAHERRVLERAASLRREYLAGGVAERVAQEEDALQTVSELVALGEAYPELRANDLYAHLSDILTALEEKIAHDRAFYNENATEYRDLVEKVPHCLIARAGGFRPPPLFRVATTTPTLHLSRRTPEP